MLGTRIFARLGRTGFSAAPGAAARGSTIFCSAPGASAMRASIITCSALRGSSRLFTQGSSIPYGQSKIRLAVVGLRIAQTPRHLSTEAAQTKGRTVDAPIVGYWSLFCASMVFGIVVWGGLTRLTESGLSIVEWKPITGAALPTSDSEWDVEFEKYKQFPEYHKVHIGLTLDDFKRIYFMEWFHRNIGRLFGVVYLVPMAYFVMKGRVTRRGAAKLGGLGVLLLGQGAMGWYMVASGLEEELRERADAIPRVSQYRLTSHLSLAYLLYAGLALYGWNVLRTNRLARNKLANPEHLRALLQTREITSFRRKTAAATLLVGTTCLSGAMVAGLDAGLLYNEFPMMGEGFVPPVSELWHEFYTRGDATAMWRNLTENPTMVQLEHRVLAMTTFFVLSALWYKGRGLPLPTGARVALHCMYGLAGLQVALGISTLVNGVPIANASAHQANSVLLLASALRLFHTLRPLPRI